MPEQQTPYEELASVVHDYREAQYDKHRGHAFAHYQEHEDGTRTVTLPSGDIFHRSQRGILRLDLVQARDRIVPTTYPMFVRAHSRWWHSLLTAYHRDVVDDVLGLARAHYGREIDQLSDAEAKAAFRHAHRIHGGIVQPGPYQQRARHLAKNLYRLTDPVVFSLFTRCTSPYNRSSHQYNLIAALEHPEEVNPAVLAAYVALYEPTTRHQHDPEDYPRHDPIQVTQVVRAALERQTGTLPRRTWRYLTRMKPRDAAYVLLATREHATRYIGALADSGETPRHTTLGHLTSVWTRLQQMNTAADMPVERFSQYARMLARATHKSRRIKALIRDLDRAQVMTDWLASNPPLTSAQAALPLEWWQQQARAWHDDPGGPIQQAQRRREQESKHYRERNAWLQPLREQHALERRALTASLEGFEVALPEFTLGRVTARALTTPAALKQEGEEMQHCVGGYGHICARGSSRIYALDGNDARSTLELAFDEFRGAWCIQQHYAERNRDPIPSHQKTARALAQAYSEQQATPHTDPYQALEKRHAREMRERERAFRPGLEPAATPLPQPTNPMPMPAIDLDLEYPAEEEFPF